MRAHVAPYKIPHKIEFTESLPKSAVGKILRSALTPRPKL
jgi:long-chain acyl-CoA synthetase